MFYIRNSVAAVRRTGGRHCAPGSRVWILLVASDIATRCAPTMAVERRIGRPVEPLLTAKWRLQKTAFERGVVLATGAHRRLRGVSPNQLVYCGCIWVNCIARAVTPRPSIRGI